MRLPLILCVVLAAACCACAGPIAADGTSRYAIVVASGAPEAELNAARELQAFLAAASGAELPITSAAAHPGIYVGQGAAGEFFGLDFSDYGPDEICREVRGEDLILAGAAPRGTLYSVYDFIESSLGVRFLATDCTVAPQRPVVELPAASFRYRPAFTRRECYYRDVVGENGAAEQRFALRRRMNGFFQDIPEAWGGTEKMLGFCHTFGQLIHEDVYFADHPEWFSMDENGNRVAGHLLGQLCLTDPGLRAEFVRKTKAWLADHWPSKQFIAISMNDNDVYCHCPACAESDRRLGSPSDTLLDFINLVAEELERDFPGIRVETLAYLYAAEPPRTVRPRHNVIVRLCSLHADFSKPIDSQANAEFRDQVIEWGRIAPGQLGIWHYVINFDNPLTVHPNVTLFAEDWRFFRDHGVTLSYAEGDAGGLLGYMRELRLWVLTALAWNPDLDGDALIAGFIADFYGPAAPAVAEFVALVERQGRESGVKIAYAEKDATGWFSPEAVREGYMLFDRAFAAAGGDPVLLDRLRKARVGLDLACLDWRIRDRDVLRGALPSSRELIDGIQELIDALPRPMYENLLGKYRRNLLSHPADDPLLAPVIGNRRCIDFQEFFYYNGSRYARLAEDSLASEGWAVRFEPGYASQWGAGIFLWQPEIRHYEDLEGERHFYATVRCEDLPERGTVLVVGLYDRITREFFLFREIDASECGRGGYALIDLGTARVSNDADFYLEIGEAYREGRLWLDRVLMVETP